MRNKKAFPFISIISILILGCSGKNTTTPVRKDIIDVVFASGHLAKTTEYLVTANTEGFLNHSLVKEGDVVHIGDNLFQLSNQVQSAQLENALANFRDAKAKVDANSPQLTQLRLQIDQAETQLQLDRKNMERYRALLQTNAVSQLDYDKAKVQFDNSKAQVDILKKSLSELEQSLQLNLENARNQLRIQQENNEDYFIKSQISGTVLNVFKEQGELVKRGESIAKIGGGGDIIKLFVAEEDIDKVALGQKAKISLNTEKEAIFDAEINKIYPAFDEAEQSFVIEATFIDKPKSLYTGTQLQANIVIADISGTLVIPTSYLVKDSMVILADSKVEIPIRLGVRTDDWVEVLIGLKENTEIEAPKNNKE
ncbi:HlyD family efflux transporter periplasmic adaptor subunit [Muricauda sp. 334s03]|uniref:HlyD family efflux transporter periplasmic adaptor subunit n=1 Tax=Flagellimonas yonaguniensis TaxID=3031325 RepID=A0ABT5XY10_9FLAO|nr:HlyD family efflux transporter periplasmic adaptor subunit [[Muricauda] yonaguniensis]MDF0715971.1 HlyD family efflux transporter periplasmic adaptor subunit [[Muricauda] yonaguniensis]